MRIPADGPLSERAQPYRVFGPSAYRPAPEDALLATVGDQAIRNRSGKDGWQA